MQGPDLLSETVGGARAPTGGKAIAPHRFTKQAKTTILYNISKRNQGFCFVKKAHAYVARRGNYGILVFSLIFTLEGGRKTRNNSI